MVVGGASGFGKATAESLAKAGANVAILDRAQSDGKGVAAAIGTTFAGTETVLKQAIDELGGLHIVVTTVCGGIDLNLIGSSFNISRLAACQMSKQEPVDDDAEERGVIIDTASIAAFEGRIGQVAYRRPRPRSRACA